MFTFQNVIYRERRVLQMYWWNDKIKGSCRSKGYLKIEVVNITTSTSDYATPGSVISSNQPKCGGGDDRQGQQTDWWAVTKWWPTLWDTQSSAEADNIFSGHCRQLSFILKNQKIKKKIIIFNNYMYSNIFCDSNTTAIFCQMLLVF